MGPINYSVDVQSPFQAALQGYQVGAEIRTDLQKQQEALRQQQLAEQQQADLAALIRNPAAGARDYAAMTLKYPKLREQFKQSWETLSADQKQSELDLATRAYAAISSNRPDLAESILRDRATAMRNGGAPEEQVKAQETWADLIKTSPEQARHIGGLMLSSVMGDKFGETFGKLGAEQRAQEQAPGALRKVNADATAAEADAVTKGVTAKYAEPQAIKDLELKGWNIKAIQEDIAYKKESNRIAAINSSLAKEGNSIRTQELQAKLEEAVAKRDEKVRERAAEGEQRVGGLVDARTLIREIKDLREAAFINPTGITAGAALMPGSNARSQSGKIEQLRNTLTLDFLDKLKGPTSDRDIAFLKNIAANLDLWQSDKRFAKELEKVDAALERADEAMRRKYGMPPAPKPSNPKPEAGQPTDGASVSGW